MIRIKAHFDGTNLCPDEPVQLPCNVPLTVLVSEREVAVDDVQRDALDVFSELERESGLIDGPVDWAEEHDHHLFGAPRQSDGPAE